MRILVLGGTAFAGRAIVEDALRSGAEVTLFGGEPPLDRGFTSQQEQAVLAAARG